MWDTVSLPTVPWQTIDVTNRTKGVNDLLENAKQAGPREDESQVKKACAELESLFIHYLFKEMRATVPKSGLITGGKAEEVYTSMLDCQMAKELSDRGGLGLSSLLSRQLDGERE